MCLTRIPGVPDACCAVQKSINSCPEQLRLGYGPAFPPLHGGMQGDMLGWEEESLRDDMVIFTG